MCSDLTVKDFSGFQLYSLFLTAAASPLQTGTEAKDWCLALQTGIQAMMKWVLKYCTYLGPELCHFMIKAAHYFAEV